MKKIIFLTLFLSIAALVMFLNFEPTVGQAAFQATTTVSLTVSSDISLTCSEGSPTAAMVPNLDLTYNSAVGTTTCNVKSNSGYYVSVKATTSPALVSGSNYFSDLGTTTTATWNTGAATDYKFGFTAYGTDVSDTKFGTQTSCGSGGTSADVTNTGALYTGFTTTGTTTASSLVGIPQTGNDVTVCYGAGKEASASVQSGNYAAGIVITAVQQ